MALLKFRCTRCNKVFDELVSMDKLDKLRCPDCGGEVVRAYEGKCPSHGKGGCGGNCAGCSGCNH